MPWSITTAPKAEPVALADLRTERGIEHHDHDVYLARLITAARLAAESYLGQQLVTATITLYLDKFPDVIRPPMPPLQSVTSIKYYDSDGNQQTLATADYTVDTTSSPGRISPAYGTTWPITRGIDNAVEVIYVAGYGDPEDVPANVRQAILMHAGMLYEVREPITIGVAASKVPYTIESLLDSASNGQYFPQLGDG